MDSDDWKNTRMTLFVDLSDEFDTLIQESSMDYEVCSDSLTLNGVCNSQLLCSHHYEATR